MRKRRYGDTAFKEARFVFTGREISLNFLFVMGFDKVDFGNTAFPKILGPQTHP